jgi:hypothetical protein
MTGQLYIPSIGTGVYEGAIQIREQGYVGSNQSDWNYAPAITFHWGNRHVQRFGVRADGLFAVDNEPLALRSWVTSQSYLTALPSHNHDDRYYTESESDSRFAAISHSHDDRYYTESESDSRFVNASGDSMSGSLTLDAGAAYVGTHGAWTGEQNKIQWHSSHLYFQNRGGGNFFFRRSDGTNILDVDNGGNLIMTGGIYPSGQTSYYLYQANSGLWTNGNFGASGDLYLGTRSTWLSSWLNQSVQTGANPTFGEIYVNGRYSYFGASSGWDSGSLNGQNGTITNVHFQGHQDFWIGAGNTQWYTSAVSGHHDLLINTMQSGGSNVRGITFTASAGGASVYRLGRWHSGTSAITSYLNLENRLAVGVANYAYSLPSATVYVKGSTDGADVLAVDGVNGRLFTVTDSVLDTIYSVNTIAGLPIIEVLANSTVKIGKYGANSITISDSKIAINSDSVDAKFPFYVGDRSTSSSRYNLTNPGMGFNLADGYAQLQLYGTAGAYIDFVNSATDYQGRIMWNGSAFSIIGNMSWGGATLSNAVWNGTAISDSYISSASNWNTAYNKRPTGVAFSGSSTKTLTLTLGDGSTLTAAFNDIDTDTNSDGQTLSINGSTLTISGGNSVTIPSGGMSQATADGRYTRNLGYQVNVGNLNDLDGQYTVNLDGYGPINGYGGPDAAYNASLWGIGNRTRGAQIYIPYAYDNLYFRRGADDWSGWFRALNTSADPYPSNMNQYVRTSDAVTFTNVYNYGWFRNYNTNEGVYNQATGTHFYSSNGSGWTVTGSGGVVELVFRSNHQSTIRGYVYADTSNNIGFLNNAGNWSLLTDSARSTTLYGNLTVGQGVGASSIFMHDSDEGTREIHCNSNRIGFLNQSGSWGSWCDDSGNWITGAGMYAAAFYDNDNSAFYLDPAGSSRIRNLYVGDSGSNWSDPGGWGTQVWFSNAPHTRFVVEARTPGIQAGIYVHTPDQVYIGSYTGHNVSIMRGGNRRLLIEDGRVYSDVYMEAAGSMRSPIFYDSDDTGYYLDPNGTSNLYRFGDATLNRHSLNSKQSNSPWSTRAAQGALYQTGAMGWGQYDLNTIGSYWGSGFFDTWSTPANGPGASSHYVGMQAFHYNNSDGSRFHGWQMVCSQEANNRWFWRSAWDTPRSWVEMIHSGNIGSQTVSRADGALKLWAESHPTDYYVRANWTGSYWQLTSNHPSGVQVAYADSAGSASSASSASSATIASTVTVNSGNGSGSWYPILWHSGNSVYSSSGTAEIYPAGGYGRFQYINTTDNDESGITRFVIKNGDSYHRSATTTVAADIIRGVASGSWSITAARATRANGNFYIDDNYGNTVVGVYTSTRFQGVFAMGDAYKLAADGTSCANHYGIAWSHPNAGGEAANLTNHGMLVQNVGRTWTAISDTIWCIGDIIAYSDARVKANIEVIDNPLERLSKVRGVTFTRTDLADPTKRYTGVIAQEMREALPEAVSENANGELSVSYGNTVSLLIESIKAQQVQIEELKAEVKKLRGA